MSARSEPPTVVGVHISKGERHDFGAAAPLPTRASSLKQGRAGGLVESSPKTGLPTNWERQGCQKLGTYFEMGTDDHRFVCFQIEIS